MLLMLGTQKDVINYLDLFRKEQNGAYLPIKLSHTFNANSKKEQKRMYAQFPLDENIIVCVYSLYRGILKLAM